MEQENKVPEPVDNIAELSKEFADIESEVQGVTVGLIALAKKLKALEKRTTQVIKLNSKKKKTQKKEVSAPIDTRLMKFMGLSEPHTTRSEALRKISEYVRNTQLQMADDKRTFVTDNTLASLFNLPKGQKMTFLAINKHVTPLFNLKSSTPEVAVPVVAPTTKVVEVKSSKSKKSKTVEK